jgi:hypothetical protein
VLAAAAVLAACSGDDGDGGDAQPDDTTQVVVVDSLVVPPEAIEEPVGTVVVSDTGFVPRVLADDVVTAEELTTAYTSYIDCLAAGGGSGLYAYDLDLLVGLTMDWRIGGDGGRGQASNTLDASCSESYLGDIANRFFATTPRPDDLQERQHDSITACVEAIDPAVAREIPDDITTDTAVEGVYIDEVQADLAFLGADADNADEISSCFTRVGVPWQRFGSPASDQDSTPESTPSSS